jgi:hypothetical protein
MANLKFEVVTFSPAEVESIAGVSPSLQRDWRRRKFLPKNAGRHARFDAYQLMEIWAMRALADRGIGPADSSQPPIVDMRNRASVAARIGRIAVINALQDRRAWTLDLPNGFQMPDADGRDVAEVAAYEREGNKLRGWPKLASRLAFELEDFLSIAARGDDGAIMYFSIPRFCVWWAGDQLLFTSAPQHEFNLRLETNYRGDVGAAVIIDTKAWGQGLLFRAKRSLVTVGLVDQ